MGTDLVLKGALCLKPVGGSMTDVSAEVNGVTIKVTVADVVVPPTLANGTSHAAGAAKYEISFDYLSDDADSGIVFGMLWDAIGTSAKTLQFQCTLRDGPK